MPVGELRKIWQFGIGSSFVSGFPKRERWQVSGNARSSALWSSMVSMRNNFLNRMAKVS